MKHTFILFAFLFAFHLSNAQNNFYDANTIQVVKIYFPFSDWDYQLDTLSAGSDGWLFADSVIINGVHFDSVGVKYKGNSSNNASNKKNPFHLSLDEVKGSQDYQGYTDVKLNNGAFDPSLVREIASYTLLSRYMDGPKANYATVYVNNVWRGIYSNIESINKKFIGEHYYSKSGAFFKCNPRVYSATTYPNLVPSIAPYTWDTTSFTGSAYPNRYEIKSSTGWAEFINFQNKLATNTNAIKTELDIDRTLWMLAFNNVYINLDSYTGAFSQNYYMYKDVNGLWIPTVWDLNMNFGSFTNLGNGNNLSFAGMQQLPVMSQSTVTTKPLISQIISNPTYKKMYVAHCKTILQESMAGNDYYNIANAAKTLINDSIMVDSLLFYTYAKFLMNIDTAVVTTGTNQKIGIRQLMNARASFLNATAEFTATAPTISNVTSAPTNVALNATVTVTATITNTDSVFLGYREIESKPFTRIAMLDDGVHGDGAAADGVFGVSFTASSGKMDYYIYASNTNAGIFSPVRAEHEFYTLLPNTGTIPSGKLVINEIMPSNTISIADANGQYDDYIELFNNTSAAINLTGLYLSDDANNLLKWPFPSTATIPANGYLLVWADQDATQTGLHASFKLSGGGEQLFLSNASGAKLDTMVYATMAADKAYGRCTNGVGAFTINLSATPNSANSCAVSIADVISGMAIKVYPNPAHDYLNIETNKNMHQLQLFNSMGSIVWQQSNISNNFLRMATSGLSAGVYFLKIDAEKMLKVVVK